VVKAWRVKLLSSWGFDQMAVVVLTSTSYLKCRVDPTKGVTSFVKTSLGDVANVVAKDNSIRLIVRNTARKSMASALTLGVVPASELLFDDFSQIDGLGVVQSLENSEDATNVLRGFQLVHRRFVTPPDNVQVVSHEQATAYRTEFGGKKPEAAPKTADGAAAAAAPAVPFVPPADSKEGAFNLFRGAPAPAAADPAPAPAPGAAPPGGLFTAAPAAS
jgi:hypothetical protein